MGPFPNKGPTKTSKPTDLKTSKSKDGKFIPQYNIKDSDVFNSIEQFEIEIEFNNLLIQTRYDFENNLYVDLRKTIKYILIGLQQTNFPIQISEQNTILILCIISSTSFFF